MFVFVGYFGCFTDVCVRVWTEETTTIQRQDSHSTGHGLILRSSECETGLLIITL